MHSRTSPPSEIQFTLIDMYHGSCPVDEAVSCSLHSVTKRLNKSTNDGDSTDEFGSSDRQDGQLAPTTLDSATSLTSDHPGDSKPESESNNRAAMSGGSQSDAALISGLVIALLVALAMLMARSGSGRGSGMDRAYSDVMANGESPFREEALAPAASVTSLASRDGSQLIPLDRDLLLAPEGLVVGRTLEMCHVEIREHAVSLRHLRLRLVRGALWIEDLNSSGGTEVDGKVLEPYMPLQVSPGQVLQIGTRSYELRDGDQGRAS